MSGKVGRQSCLRGQVCSSGARKMTAGARQRGGQQPSFRCWLWRRGWGQVRTRLPVGAAGDPCFSHYPHQGWGISGSAQHQGHGQSSTQTSNCRRMKDETGKSYGGRAKCPLPAQVPKEDKIFLFGKDKSARKHICVKGRRICLLFKLQRNWLSFLLGRKAVGATSLKVS